MAIRQAGAAMQRILAVLWGDDDAGAVLGAAFAMAEPFGAEVAGIYVRPPPGEFIPSGDIGMALSQDYLDRLHRDSSAKAARLRAEFQGWVSRLGIPAERTGPGVSAVWIDAEGSAATVI